MAPAEHEGRGPNPELVIRDGKQYIPVKEGLARILVPAKGIDAVQQPASTVQVQSVFYNPIQQFNRDLTVLAITAYGSQRLAEKNAALHQRLSKATEKKRKREEQNPRTRHVKVPKLGEDDPMLASNDLVAREQEDVTEAEGTLTTTFDSGAIAHMTANTELKDITPATEPEADQNKIVQTNGEEKRTSADFTILDALSATGLRALRYALEIPFVTSVTANDLLAAATRAIKLNVEYNNLEGKIHVSHDDALAHMYSVVVEHSRRRDAKGPPTRSGKYDVVDLDPYGTAAHFLDAAVQAVRDDGGLLCVTCTDASIWASNGYPEKAYSLYGGIPLKGGNYSHEGGLRLILHAIQSSAARYGLAIEPLLSLSIDFYARVFVRVRKSPAAVKFQAGKTMLVYTCDSGCGAWTTQLLAINKSHPNKKGTGHFYKHVYAQATVARHCEHCGKILHLSGPMYAGRIHSPAFIQAILARLKEAPDEIYGTGDRIEGMLQTAMEEFLPTKEEEELHALSRQAEERDDGTVPNQQASAIATLKELETAGIDPYPFYFTPEKLSGIIHCATPSEAMVRSALLGLGYRVTRSHCKRNSIKTDAPWSVIWHVMREWIRQKAPIKPDNIKAGSPASRLLQLDKTNGTADSSVYTGTGAPAAAAVGDEVGNPNTAADVRANVVTEVPAAETVAKEVIFDEKLGKDPTKGKILRYQLNPRENWGPMTRAKGR